MVTLNGEKSWTMSFSRIAPPAPARQGKQLGEDVIWGAGLFLADSEAEAKRRVEPAAR